MAKYDLKYFMREELKSDEIVEVPGVATFSDEEDKPIPLQFRVLGKEEINAIRKKFTKNKIVCDEKGKRLFDKSGRPVIEAEIDNFAATNRLIVESLVFPNLKDPELMSFYSVLDATDMPNKIFKHFKDHQYVEEQMLIALGISDEEAEPTDDELINEAKNS